MRGQREHLEAVGVPGHDVERARADRARGAEHAHALARHHRLGSYSETRAKARGNTGSNASMRSSTPPWPGSSALLSFAPTLRLTRDSKRSPTTLIEVRKSTPANMPTTPTRSASCV